MKNVFLAAVMCLFSTAALTIMEKITFYGTLNHDPNKTLSSEQVTEEIQLIEQAAARAYSGSRFLPGHQYKNFIVEIKLIKGPVTAKDFCYSLALAMSKVSDNHFDIRMFSTDWKPKFFKKKSIKKKIDVGGNFYRPQKGQKHWEVRLDKISNNKVLKISTTHFPFHTSKTWEGFIESVKQKWPQSDLAIIDLRGTSGGSDAMGFSLSTLLAGQRLKTMQAPQFLYQTPESFQLMVNLLSIVREVYKASGDQNLAHIDQLIREYQTKRDDALKNKGPEEIYRDINEEAFDFNSQKALNRPIYLLTDGVCTSSCESTIDAFELNPNVIRVGAPTAGSIHFGNSGYLPLPHSGGVIQMAQNYNSYKDGRFLEKIGIGPDIPVADGRDALDVAINDYQEKHN